MTSNERFEDTQKARSPAKVLRRTLVCAVVLIMMCLVLAAPAGASSGVVDRVDLGSDSLTISQNSTYWLYPFVYDTDGDYIDEPVTWSCVGESIVDFDSPDKDSMDIILRPLAVGNTTIRATSVTNPDVYDEMELTIVPTVISNIYLAESVTVFLSDDSCGIDIYVADQFGNALSGEAVSWSVSDEDIVELEVNGHGNGNTDSNDVVLYPVSAGTAEVYATVVNAPHLSAVMNVTVEEAVISSLSLPYSANHQAIGSSWSYSVDGLNQYGDLVSVDDSLLFWESSNEDVVKITDRCSLDSCGVGTAVVTVSLISNPDIYARMNVTVYEPVYSRLSINPLHWNITFNGLFYPSVDGYDQYEDWTSVDDSLLSFESSNEDIVTITDDGGLEAQGVGTAVVTVSLISNPAVSAEMTVTVYEPVYSSLSIPESSMNLPLDYTRGPSVIGYDQYDEWDYVDDSLLSLESSNENVVAITDDGSLEARSVGTAVVTVSLISNPAVSAEMTVTVYEPVYSSLSIPESSMNLPLDYTRGPSVIGYDQYDEWDYVDDSLLSWKSSNEDIVTVTNDGLIEPQSVGTAVVTVSLISNPAVSAEVTVTVYEPVYSNLSMQEQLNMTLDSTCYLSVEGYDQYDEWDYVDDSLLSWKSSNEDIVTVTNDGLIEPQSVGTAVVTVSLISNPAVSAEVTVTVYEPVYSRLSMPESSVNLALGHDYCPDVSGYDQYDEWTSVDDSLLSWKSSNENVIEITDDGSLEARGVGTAVVTVRLISNPAISAEMSVTVYEPVYSRLSMQEQLNMTLDSTCYLSVEGYDQYNDDWSYISDSLLVWSSSNEDVLKVDYYGELYPQSIGTAVVRASLTGSNLYAETVVTVEETVISYLYFYDEELLMTLDSTHHYSVRGFDQYWNYVGGVDNSLVVWRSYNNSVVTVTNDGLIEPQSVGTAVVNVSLISNPAVSAEMSVTVYKPVYSHLSMEPSISLTLAAEDYLSVYAVDQYGEEHWLYSPKIVFTCSDESVVKVDSDGWLQPQGVGTAVIRASLAGSNLYAETKVTVEKTVISSVDEWNGDTKLSLYSETSIQNIHVYDQFGNRIPNERVNYSLSNPDVLDLDIRGDYLNGCDSLQLYGKGLGTATLRIYAENATDVYSETEITVVPSKLGNVYGMDESVTLVFDPEFGPLSNVFTFETFYQVYAQSLGLGDQFGNHLRDSVRYTVSNPDVLGIASYDSVIMDSVADVVSDITTEEGIILVPKSPGKTVVTAVSSLYPDVTRSIEVTVLDEASLIPDDMQVFGTPYITTSLEPGMSDYLGATLSTSSLFEWYGDPSPYPLTNHTVRWTVDDSSVLSLSDEITKAGEMLTMTAHSAGTATVTATAVSNSSLTCSITVRVMEENPLTVEVTPEIITEAGSDVVISGTAVGTDTLRYYYFGYSGFTSGSISVNADGTYQKVIDADEDGGIILIQNPMEDGFFNVGITTEDESDYYITLNENGDVSGSSKVVEEFSEFSSLAGVCSTYGVDDVCVFAAYYHSYANGGVTIDSTVYTVERGEQITISGTKIAGDDKYGIVESYFMNYVTYSLTHYWYPFYNSIIGYDFSGSSSTWETTVDTTNLIPGTYLIVAIDYAHNDGAQSIVTITMPDLEYVEPTPGTVPSELSLIEGWNFISIPKALDASNSTAAKLFGSIDTAGNAILGYNASSQSWEQVTADTVIKPLSAYWIYANTSTVVPLTYSDIPTTPGLKSLYPGWNAVGLSAEVDTAASSFFAGLKWRVALPWNCEKGVYDSAIVNGGSTANSPDRLLSLGNGCWLYVEEANVLPGLTA